LKISQRHQISHAIRSTLVLWVLTAFIYPLFMLISGQVAFSDQVNGSLIGNSQGVIIGSALIGQPFASENFGIVLVPLITAQPTQKMMKLES
jgi:K+-transporting ATPase ATPase C chain